MAKKKTGAARRPKAAARAKPGASPGADRLCGALGVVLLAMGVFSGYLMWMDGGAAGEAGSALGALRDGLRGATGMLSYITPVLLGALGVTVMFVGKQRVRPLRALFIFAGALLFFGVWHVFAADGIAQTMLTGSYREFIKASYEEGMTSCRGAGALGALTSWHLFKALDAWGAAIALICMLIVIALGLSRTSMREVGYAITERISDGVDEYRERRQVRGREKAELRAQSLERRVAREEREREQRRQRRLNMEREMKLKREAESRRRELEDRRRELDREDMARADDDEYARDEARPAAHPQDAPREPAPPDGEPPWDAPAEDERAAAGAPRADAEFGPVAEAALESAKSRSRGDMEAYNQALRRHMAQEGVPMFLDKRVPGRALTSSGVAPASAAEQPPEAAGAAARMVFKGYDEPGERRADDAVYSSGYAASRAFAPSAGVLDLSGAQWREPQTTRVDELLRANQDARAGAPAEPTLRPQRQFRDYSLDARRALHGSSAVRRIAESRLREDALRAAAEPPAAPDRPERPDMGMAAPGVAAPGSAAPGGAASGYVPAPGSAYASGIAYDNGMPYERYGAPGASEGRAGAAPEGEAAGRAPEPLPGGEAAQCGPDRREEPAAPELANWQEEPDAPELANWREEPGAPELANWQEEPDAPELADWREEPGAPELADWREEPGAPELADWQEEPGAPELADWHEEPAQADRQAMGAQPEPVGQAAPERGGAELEGCGGEPEHEAGAQRVAMYTPVKADLDKPLGDGTRLDGTPIRMPKPAMEEIPEEKPYFYPPIDLLEFSKGSGVSLQEQQKLDAEKALKLEETLKSFGIQAKVVGVSRGPAVTRFELTPAPGVRVSKIAGLADDIALNLAATTVRIEAPIPGKSAVGIELPNEQREMVTLRDVLDSPEAARAQSRLAVALGKDNAGKLVIADIARMPHVLIAGATGSGKSVCINTIIMSILYRATPDEVRMILIDPKVVELSVYNGVPHLLVPVVTDPKKAASALNWAVLEMTERYQKFAERGVRDIRGFNHNLKPDEKPLPQIVVIIDELADLMMVAPGEVEDAICRLAQLARAAGIHLVIATQRPSVNVITGVIKANIPSRIAFTVTSQVDSRTILDGAGAEKLLGRGDMLFFPQGVGKPQRVQGANVTDEEVNAVTEFIKSQHEAVYNPDIMEQLEREDQSDAEKEEQKDDECDPLLPQAVEIAVELGQVSISMLQRRMRIGYARAGRIVDEMARRGIIGEAEGAKPRMVLMSREEFKRLYGDGAGNS